MYPTKNNLAEKVRVDVVELLNARLADAIDLFNQSKQAHWNVKGSQFIALHQLFDEIADHVEEYADSLAERAVQLGGVAEGTSQVVAKRTSLAPYELGLVSGRDHVDALSSALADFGGKVRTAIDTTDGRGDRDTADLFTEISRQVDKDLWFLEAHLQGERSSLA
jgi:starvation-inducible DNA-binding protein